MTLPEIKQLDKIIALCRKRGVSEITVEGVTIKLGDAPVKRNRQAKGPSKPFHQDDNRVETSELTPEQLLFYSVQDNLSLGEDEKAQ